MTIYIKSVIQLNHVKYWEFDQNYIFLKIRRLKLGVKFVRLFLKIYEL